MSLRIRFAYDSGNQLGYSIERLSDGLLYDFSAAAGTPTTGGSFVANPGTLTAPLPEDTGAFFGRYKATLATTPATVFTDGDYVVTVHDLARLAAKESSAIAELGVSMVGGDDATPTPAVLVALILKAAAGKTLTLTLPS